MEDFDKADNLFYDDNKVEELDKIENDQSIPLNNINNHPRKLSPLQNKKSLKR